MADGASATGLSSSPWPAVRLHRFRVRLEERPQFVAQQIRVRAGSGRDARRRRTLKVSPSALAARLHRLGLLGRSRRDEFRGFTTEICHFLAGRLDDHYRHRAESAAPRPPLVPLTQLLAAYESGETTLRPVAAYPARTVDDLRAVLQPACAPRPLPEDEKGDPVFQP